MIDQLLNKTQSTGYDKAVSMSSGYQVRRKTDFPRWLRKPIPPVGKRSVIEKYLRQGYLHTVCEEAKCPNRNECFASGTATFLIMGDLCTRNCLFCSIKYGTPFPLDSDEPERICKAAKKMGLSYVVLTSVTRDDLEDGGAGHIAETVSMLKKSGIKVEALVPDFCGSTTALATVLASGPDVFNHNIETVPAIFSHIRPDADYTLSLQVLRWAAENSHDIPIKSGFMVGLGEIEEEVISLMDDLRKSKVTALTIGQYLQPSENQVRVKEFIPPDQFDHYSAIAKELGFSHVCSAPFVRSSYKAVELFNH